MSTVAEGDRGGGEFAGGDLRGRTVMWYAVDTPASVRSTAESQGEHTGERDAQGDIRWDKLERMMQKVETIARRAFGPSRPCCP